MGAIGTMTELGRGEEFFTTEGTETRRFFLGADILCAAELKTRPTKIFSVGSVSSVVNPLNFRPWPERCFPDSAWRAKRN